MADINHQITLGIGTPASIGQFITLGLFPSDFVVAAALGDLTTLFAEYLEDLNAADVTEDDNATLVSGDLDTVRAGTSISEVDDANTMYARYIAES